MCAHRTLKETHIGREQRNLMQHFSEQNPGGGWKVVSNSPNAMRRQSAPEEVRPSI